MTSMQSVTNYSQELRLTPRFNRTYAPETGRRSRARLRLRERVDRFEQRLMPTKSAAS